MAITALLDSSLAYVTHVIHENPDAPEARINVVSRFNEVLSRTQHLQGYSASDFLKLMKLSILSIGYGRKEIADTILLSRLSDVVPQSLSAEILFPVVEEGSRRRLWYWSDADSDVAIATALRGEAAAFEIHRRFGDYAMFLAGVMPDVLERSRRKGGVDVPYYERTGAKAFGLAVGSGSPGIEDAVLGMLASDFHDLRILLNEAGALVGTAAARTVFENALSEYGIGGQYLIPRGPLSRGEVSQTFELENSSLN